MTDFEEIPTVRVARPVPAGRWRAAAAIAVVLLLVVIVKPWGDSGRQITARPSQGPFATATPTTRPSGRYYDPALFGKYEIKPAWEIWPAGYVYAFGIAGPLPLDSPSPRPSTSPLDSPGASAAPEPSPTPTPTPAPTPPPGAADLVDLGSADHLVVIALNTPATVQVTRVRLWWFDQTGRPEEVPILELPPPWPVTYFHVYGIQPSRSGDQVGEWRPGSYRLDVTIGSGGTVRGIGLLVAPGADEPIID